MGRPCTVCYHPDLQLITADVMIRVPYRTIEKRYGLSSSAIDRHVSQHVEKALRKLVATEMALSDAAVIAEPVLHQCGSSMPAHSQFCEMPRLPTTALSHWRDKGVPSKSGAD